MVSTDELVMDFVRPYLHQGVNYALNKLFKKENFGTKHQVVRGKYAVGALEYSDKKVTKRIYDELKIETLSENKFNKFKDDILVLYFNNEAVGYFMPKWEADEHVRPALLSFFAEYKGLGHEKALLKICFEDSMGKVLLKENDTPMIAAYVHAGFHKTNQSLYIKGEKYQEYRKDSI